MKKILSVLIIALLVVGITGCAGDSILPSGNNVGDEDAMNQNEISSGSIGQDKGQIHSGTPLYQNKEFFNIEDLIEWIQTEDIENFQDGRYKNGILSLRNRGEVLFPSFHDPNMPSPRIEIFPDNFHPDGHTVIGFFYYIGDEMIVIPVKEMNSSHLNLAISEGIGGYLTAQYGVEYARSPIFQAEIEINEIAASEISEISLERTEIRGSANNRNETAQEISYAMTRTSGAIGSGVDWAIFLADEFEVRIIQHNDEWNSRYLNELSLHTITLNN